MSAKSKLSTLILTLSLVFLYAGCLAFAKQDPELKQCTHQCRVQQQYDEKQKEECVRTCEEYHREKKDRESLKEVGQDPDVEFHPGDGLSECQSRCAGLAGEVRQLCLFRCQQKWRRDYASRWEEEGKKQSKEDAEDEGEEEKHNPYVFEDKHFSTAIKTGKGRVDLLTKFTHNSDILRGIENYRLALLVASPKSFVVPNHFDANAIFVVTQGRGTLTLIHEDKRESFNIETGDIIYVRAGTPLYLINRDDNEKLFIVKLLQPINQPDHYEVFYGAGGAKPESFYETFSTEILEAALKTSRDKLEKFFDKQGKGPFLEASKEQIEAMSSQEEGSKGGGLWPFGSESKSESAFNLFRKRQPSHCNRYGQLFEVEEDEFKGLKDFDLRVSYVNITKGCMSAPFYNSRAIKIAIVVKGEGYFEMVSPPVSPKSSQEDSAGRKSGSRYQKISSRLRSDTVFVVPAGHPFVTVASRNNNLEILCFEVNIENNVRYLLAGEGNYVQQFEKEAKELAFKSKEEEVDRIFGNQDEEFFFPGPRQQRGRYYE
ncbi:hypothetical protein ES319_A12G003200v1 [Gossypium barbadense]|uniref:Cupin type-1 domain-containing protein n=1 Tax=Gossypium barbadense TaxID=3634 RepID=A0A5J5T4S1_GOSBA|nr:hypothetical protein ES319_A12G003200v1 [Gossypium barbadense]